MPLDPATARRVKSEASVKLVVLHSFLGLGFHKACVLDCASFLGVVDCSAMNHGVGTTVRAKLLGFELYLDGRLALADNRAFE